jgi:hypothetical protein
MQQAHSTTSKTALLPVEHVRIHRAVRRRERPCDALIAPSINTLDGNTTRPPNAANKDALSNRLRASCHLHYSSLDL